jgi:hypothetical protein
MGKNILFVSKHLLLLVVHSSIFGVLALAKQVKHKRISWVRSKKERRNSRLSFDKLMMASLLVNFLLAVKLMTIKY